MEVITRRQWPWIASSEMMFVYYYFWSYHHDNVQDWINLQWKQNASYLILFSGDRISASDDKNSLSDPASP